jgi:hypothetical protein
LAHQNKLSGGYALFVSTNGSVKSGCVHSEAASAQSAARVLLTLQLYTKWIKLLKAVPADRFAWSWLTVCRLLSPGRHYLDLRGGMGLKGNGSFARHPRRCKAYWYLLH